MAAKKPTPKKPEPKKLVRQPTSISPTARTPAKPTVSGAAATQPGVKTPPPPGAPKGSLRNDAMRSPVTPPPKPADYIVGSPMRKPNPTTKLNKGAKPQDNKATLALQKKIAAKQAAGQDTTHATERLAMKQAKIGNRRAEQAAQTAKGKGRTGMAPGSAIMGFMDAAGAAKTGKKVPHLAGTRFGNKKDLDKFGVAASVKGGRGGNTLTGFQVAGGGRGGGGGGGRGGDHGKLIPPPGTTGGVRPTPPPVAPPKPVVETKPPPAPKPPPVKVTPGVSANRPAPRPDPKGAILGGNAGGGGTGLGGDAMYGGRAHQGSGKQNDNRKGNSRFRFA